MAARKDGQPKALTPHQLKSQQLYLLDEDKKLARRKASSQDAALSSSLTPQERQSRSEEIAKHTAEFLSRGGKIQKIPAGKSASIRVEI